MRSIKVNLDKKTSSSYEIRIGSDILDRISLLIAKNHKRTNYIIVTDSNVAEIHGTAFLSALRGVGLEAHIIEFPAGEISKNISTVFSLVDKMLAIGVDRSSLLIALGGGVVGDLTGFLASIYMRHIPYLQVPTTLIGQVDSSIGGKTGVDIESGKNLIGTFYQPQAVFIDLNYLKTLPEKEFKNGLAEIIKYAAIDDEKMFRLLEENMEAIKENDQTLLLKIIENCCRIKKSIVEIDEKELGLRRILNFGHTIGHAIETQSNYEISHGQAVAMGMIAASRISVNTGHLDAASQKRLESLIIRADLPGRIPEEISTAGIISRIKLDKKKKGETVHFILLKKIGMPFVDGGVSMDVVNDVIEGMR